jgi:hypothetical protein
VSRAPAPRPPTRDRRRSGARAPDPDGRDARIEIIDRHDGSRLVGGDPNRRRQALEVERKRGLRSRRERSRRHAVRKARAREREDVLAKIVNVVTGKVFAAFGDPTHPNSFAYALSTKNPCCLSLGPHRYQAFVRSQRLM